MSKNRFNERWSTSSKDQVFSFKRKEIEVIIDAPRRKAVVTKNGVIVQTDHFADKTMVSIFKFIESCYAIHSDEENISMEE